jgi:Cu(I)/Ag(I) efflux system membrane fusion protein
MNVLSFCKVLSGILVLLPLYSCDSPAPDDTHQLSQKEPESYLSKEKTQQIVQLLNDYYHLKDALVASNIEDIDQASKSFLLSTNSLKSKLLDHDPEDSVIDINNTIRDLLVIEQSLQNILSIKNGDYEAKRIHFKPLSINLYSMLKDIRVKHALPVYYTYCPMAMNETGAYWLSPVPKINNPYFGKKMLTCGVIVDTLK